MAVSPKYKRTDNPRRSNISNNKQLFRYAGLGAQLLAAIGLSVFIGMKADKWLHTSSLLTVILPLLALIGIFYKLIRETGKPDKNDE